MKHRRLILVALASLCLVLGWKDVVRRWALKVIWGYEKQQTWVPTPGDGESGGGHGGGGGGAW